MQYSINDPEKGGIRVSFWEFIVRSGLKEYLEKNGITINPTHDFNLLLETRQKLYAKYENKFIAERKLNKLLTTDNDMVLCYKTWLARELDVIDKWLQEERAPISNIIEIGKYKSYVLQELSKGTPGNGTNENTNPKTFNEIFVHGDWKKYISIFENTDPILLNSQWEFIGKPRKHKGVICSGIKHLQNKGLVRQDINRSQLATVLNNEIQNLNLGKDGKTFANVSNEYTQVFEKQLLKLIK